LRRRERCRAEARGADRAGLVWLQSRSRVTRRAREGALRFPREARPAPRRRAAHRVSLSARDDATAARRLRPRRCRPSGAVRSPGRRGRYPEAHRAARGDLLAACPQAVTRAAVVSLALCLAACIPVGMLPGGKLDGELVTEPVNDWSFTHDVQKIQLET